MDTKQSIINEYLLGAKTYMELAKEHGVSRTTINHWVMESEGREAARKPPWQSIPFTRNASGRKQVKTARRSAGTATAAGAGKAAQQVAHSHDRHSRGGAENTHPKKVWHQAVEKVRHSEKAQSLSSLCTLPGYSRQALHRYNKNNCREVFEEELMIQEVKKHRVLQPRPRLGTRKLVVKLRDFISGHNMKTGRDALFTLLREQDLLIRRRKRKGQTTFSKHWLKKYPNLIKEYVPTAPNAVWVSDITYIVTNDGFAYLSLVIDAYSRKTVGFFDWETLEAAGSLKALGMALKGCKNTKNLIHHSDRGVQYYSKDYVKMLTKNGVKISMTENGDPLEPERSGTHEYQ